MDFLRRHLVLSLPAIAVGGLHGCGGAENDTTDKATPQAVGRSTAQAETTTNTAPGFSVKNRNGSNFPLLSGSFDILPQPKLIQAVLNAGSPGGMGPVLALQLSTSRTSGTDTLVAELSLSVKLGNTIPSGSGVYDLASGGALAGEALVTCRQIGADRSVKTYAYRIVAGSLVVSKIDQSAGTVTLSLRDVIANTAVGFNNTAQGSIFVISNNPTSLLLASESTSAQLS